MNQGGSMGEYTVEDYISFIEMGRFDKVSPIGLEMIAKRFRELEENEFRGPGEGDIECDYKDQEEAKLILINNGPSKLLSVKLLKEELGLSLRDGKILVDSTPSLIMIAKHKYINGEKTTDYKHLLEIQHKFDKIKAETQIQ